MVDTIDSKVANIKLAIKEKHDFPDYVKTQLDVVIEAQKKYYNLIIPITQNKSARKNLKDEKKDIMDKSYALLSVLYTEYRVNNREDLRNFYFGSTSPSDLKKYINKMKDIIFFISESFEINNDLITIKYKEKILLIKELLNDFISKGNLKNITKLLAQAKNDAKKKFDNEYLRLTFLIRAALVGEDLKYAMIYDTKSRKKSESKQNPTE